MKSVKIIGAGAAGLSAAIELSAKGYEVDIYDKNDQAGGRIRTWKKEGFTFDMGPSWYWMPEVFDDIYTSVGYQREDFYELNQLDPGYKVFFEDNASLEVPAKWEEIIDMFNSVENGAGDQLEKFMKEAAYKYEVGMNEFVWKPSTSPLEFVQWKVMKAALRLDMFTSISKHVRKYFKHPHLIKLMEFPVLFLGADPKNTPALYSLMNYADLKLGTWYPKGGMVKIAEGLNDLAEKLGVRTHLNQAVEQICINQQKQVQAIQTHKGKLELDGLIAAADYHYVDQELTPKSFQNYSSSYWEKRKMAPSSLLFYIGLDRKLDNVIHHNLFFDESFDKHAHDIYKDPKWPNKPLFYACVPSKTDDSVAPEACENLFLLVPLAPGLKDSQKMREQTYQFMRQKLIKFTGVDIDQHLLVKRSFAMDDFKSLYNSFKGNAYGLANVLTQTAFLKPSMNHKRLKNMFFAGQLTVPGPGLPPSIISGRLAARQMDAYFNKNRNR